MNTTPENEPTDEQLDVMLRDVQVPADLRSRLKRIPKSTASEEGGRSTQTVRVVPAQAGSKRARWRSYALAASLLAVATFASFLTTRKQDPASNLLATTTTQNADPDDQDRALQILQAEVQELEIAKLQSKLFQLEQLNSTQLSQREIESMIMALAPEHSIALGGDEAYVRAEMARVQRDYPNSRGAMLAGEILQTIN